MSSSRDLLRGNFTKEFTRFNFTVLVCTFDVIVTSGHWLVILPSPVCETEKKKTPRDIVAHVCVSGALLVWQFPFAGQQNCQSHRVKQVRDGVERLRAFPST